MLFLRAVVCKVDTAISSVFKSCGIKEVSTAVAIAAVMGNNQKETAQALLQAGFGVGVLRLRGGYRLP